MRRSSRCGRTCRSPSCRSTARPKTRSARDSCRRSGSAGDELEQRLATWRERIEHYREQRIHPRLPAKQVCCFYPMSKRRAPDANWFELSFEQRKELMGGHARVGRTYAGRVLQLITGSTGHRRLGMGRHAARRRHRRAEGDRVRDALRSGVREVRRLRSVLHRSGAARGRRVRPSRPARPYR